MCEAFLNMKASNPNAESLPLPSTLFLLFPTSTVFQFFSDSSYTVHANATTAAASVILQVSNSERASSKP
jgi:hypothetical protein